MQEGLGRKLDPGFDMFAEATPFLARRVQRRMAPDALLKRGTAGLSSLMDLLGGFPADLRRVLRVLRKGALTVHVDVSHLDRVSTRLDQSVSRLTIGIITAALIIGSSIVMTVTNDTGSGWFRPYFLGVLGFIGAVAGGIWLLLSIWSSGKRH